MKDPLGDEGGPHGQFAVQSGNALPPLMILRSFIIHNFFPVSNTLVRALSIAILREIRTQGANLEDADSQETARELGRCLTRAVHEVQNELPPSLSVHRTRNNLQDVTSSANTTPAVRT